MRTLISIIAISLIVFTTGCDNPQPGPDKTAAGALLGAAWGAGAGAVVGHQVGEKGAGAAIGAGFGAVAGAMTGYGYDQTEDALIQNEKQLASLKMQNAANARELANIQYKFDRVASSDVMGGVYQVFFDIDQTNMRAGAVANLEVIAESLKRSGGGKVNVVGHADDSGSPKYNERLAEARARNVAGYLASRGVSSGRIMVASFGSKRPIASNVTDTGRQLNRRVDVFITPAG